MARGRGLYPQITEPDNLRLAFKKAVKGKSDRREVLIFRQKLNENLVSLRHELLAGEVQWGTYHSFTIRDPKERVISAAPFRDRILHHAIVNVCEPVFERYAIFDSYACRPGKGLHKALTRAQDMARRHGWYLKLDIRKYFDSIHHETLLTLLARRFADRRLADLFRQILATYQTAPGRGLPIGNLMSQHFANLYLGRLDHWLREKHKVAGYLRYMDDFLVFAADRENLKQTLSAIREFLQQELQLELKDSVQLNRCCLGIPFLGMRISPNRIALAPRSRRRFVVKLHHYEKEAEQGALSEGELARRVHSLVAFTRTADAKGFRRSVLARQGV